MFTVTSRLLSRNVVFVGYVTEVVGGQDGWPAELAYWLRLCDVASEDSIPPTYFDPPNVHFGPVLQTTRYQRKKTKYI